MYCVFCILLFVISCFEEIKKDDDDGKNKSLLYLNITPVRFTALIGHAVGFPLLLLFLDPDKLLNQ